MDECCTAKQSELQILGNRQRRVLWIVLAINFTMFVVEVVYGIRAKSTSLLADSLDMLGDAFVYAFSLFVIGKSIRWNSFVALFKGSVMALFGASVLSQAAYRFLTPTLPVAETMGWIGGLALLANLCCAVLLLRHRHDDLNMRSTWLCSRNDVIANMSVLAAAGAVALTDSKYPDLFVGVFIAGLVLRSSATVLRDSIRALRA